MIILHENMPEEAEAISAALREVYGFDNRLINEDLTPVFMKIPAFGGFYYQPRNIADIPKQFGNKKVMILTGKDIYANVRSKDDDWIFGFSTAHLSMASSARMKRSDNQPSLELMVPKELYMKRMLSLAIHEVGHDVVKSPHFQEAVWVNAKTGYELPLGPHCTDNRCVMYEIVDIHSPPADEGFMRLGDERRLDNGLDEQIERMGANWFCDRCKGSIRVDESYVTI